ncbi:MAG TPA: 50S ribosomal protein L23 [bacterium]|nr:50S ribosomal protein L23 [bacterium]
MHFASIIKKPVVTEKSQRLELAGVYTVAISPSATKIDVRKTFETLYGVKVEKVNIIKVREKFRNTKTGIHAKRKESVKALVTLADGARIADLQKFAYKVK